MDRRLPILLSLFVLILAWNFSVGGFFLWILKDTAILSAIPLLSLFLFKISPAEVGLSLKTWRLSVKYAAASLIFALPIMYYGATLPEFRAYYPLWPPAADGARNFLLYQAAIGILMFNNEFFFRGYLLFNLKKAAGKNLAILLHAILYMLVHIGKPPLEVPYSFFAGLLFGFLAIKTRSILPGFLIHFLGSAGFEAMVIRL